MKKKGFCLVLAAVMLMSLMPFQVNAASYKYSLGVKTADVYLAGTDSTVYAGFCFYGGYHVREKCNRSGDDNERNDHRWYEFTQDTPQPWMIQDVFVELSGGNDWLCEYVDICLPYINGSLNTTSVGRAYFNTWTEDKGKIYRGISSLTQRKITNYHGGASWGGTYYLDKNSNSTMQYSWNRNITDQYGTYNAMIYDDPPVMTYSLSNSAVGTGWMTFTGPSSTQDAALSINEKLLFEAMGDVANGSHQGIGSLTLTVKLAFPKRSTNLAESGLTAMRIGNEDYCGKEMTFTFYRSCFQLGNESVIETNTFSPRTSYNYLNRTYRDISISITPTSIHCGSISSTEKQNMVDNFQCTPSLYLGNSTSNKLCDMTMKKSGTTIIFEGQVPLDKSGSANDGVRLQLDNVVSSYNGKTYMLESGSSSQAFYFSEYKVDTKAPTIQLTDIDGTEISIQNLIQKQHNFYLVSSEVLYPQENSLHTDSNQRYARYELYQKNNGTYGSSPISITGYLGSGSQTQVQVPVNTTVLTDVMIRLMPANPTEGQYKLRIYGWDDANNGLNGGNYYEIENIYLDGQAPRVEITENIQNQAVDGSKRNDYTFSMTDLQNSREHGSWARTYYCFVEDGQQMPDPEQQDIEEVTGEIETTLGMWAFVAGGTDTATAILKIQRGETFEGKLYYYTLDSSGNDSRIEQNGAYFSKVVKVYNYDSRDTLITEEYTHPKKNYDISFDKTDDNYRTEYRWVASDVSFEFRQDYRVYTGAEGVGSGEQTGSDGISYLLDGTYTLEYKVTELRSGNWRKFTKDYVFDNKGPQIRTRWLTGDSLLLQTQQLKLDIEDVSGVETAQYQIVNTDGTSIEGYEVTPITITMSLDNRGTVNDTITLSLPENGIYALIISATDKNGLVSTVDSLNFGIRNKKPQITSIEHNLEVFVDECGATADGNYVLTLNITDSVKNATSLQTEQDLRYCISADGSNYGEWITAGNVEKVTGSASVSYQLELETPFVLMEGWNTIHIKTACVNSGVVDIPSSSVVSEAISIRILFDNKPPVFELPSYSTINWTTQDVVAVIKASDIGTGVCELNTQNEDVEISEYEDGQFTVTIKDNLTEDLVLSDRLGNEILVPIAVWNIDRSEPYAEAVSESWESGARTDGKVEITLMDQTDVQISFALVNNPVDGYELTEADYLAFDNASTIFVEESETQSYEDMKTKKYTIYLRGIDGTYAVGLMATDIVGNMSEVLFVEESLTLTDAQPAIAQMTCEPMTTKSTTTVTLQFNVPLVILPNAPDRLSTMSDSDIEKILTPASLDADENFLMEYSVVCDNADTVSLYVKDECNRTAVLTFTPDATFVEGFDIAAYIEKNGEVIDNGGFISFAADDTLYYFVNSSEKYAVQYFFLDQAEYSGMQLNEQFSMLAEENEYTQGKLAYTSLCFEALHDGKTTKSVRFNSYTLEGNEEDREEEEYLAISVVDETAPTGSIEYSETKLTNKNVFVSVNMSDSESGIIKCEKSYDGGATYEEIGTTTKYTEEFGENKTVYFRLTNGAGMTTILTATVGNIDKSEITEGTHYTVEYTYENYLGEWVPVIQGKAYRSVMAAIKPIVGSGKTLSITNNSGSFTKLLTSEGNSFMFDFRDEAGNTGNRSVEYNLFDNEPGSTTWVLSNTEKTNQNIFATITVTDASEEISFVEVKKDGIVYPFTGQPLENEYVVEIDSSGVYQVTSYDGAGNSWTEIITVSNIDKTLPRVLTKLYSTPIGTITAKSVRVELTEFSKDISTIKMTGIELVSGLAEQDIVYTPGDKVIRFKKNGSVAVTFMDDYGNEGVDIVTVSNIYTNPPAVEAVAILSADQLSTNVTFEKILDQDGVPVDRYRELSDLKVTFSGITYQLASANFNLKNNGDYEFFVHDSSGATQKILLNVSGIDDRAPVIKEISWVYKYREENQSGIWEEKEVSRTIEVGKDTSGKESGYMVTADENNRETNQNVNVTVTTDKETTFVGGKDELSLKKTVEYRENGLFNFNLQAKNATSATYGVGIDVIDKTPPVITLDNGPELIFIEGMSMDKDPMYAYDKAKLMDFHAYDIKDGIEVDFTDKVRISYGSQGRVFDPDNINNNEFVRSNPYYVEYTVYDAAGNGTTIRRTIRLVGFYDTIALVNGKMPDSTNVATVSGNDVQISLKNFSGISYARYEKGIFTQGQMKTRGIPLTERSGIYSVDNVTEGWYTVYIQTDKRDYFNIIVYVVPQIENNEGGRQ